MEIKLKRVLSPSSALSLSEERVRERAGNKELNFGF
jgi:hypothetical protein